MEEVLPSPSVNLRDKGKGRAELFLGEGDSFEESSSPNGGASAIPSKKPLIRLRKSRPKGQRLGALMRQRKRRCLSSCSSFVSHIFSLHSDIITQEASPPVFWAEVYSKPDCRWLPVDPIHNHVDKRKRFEPQATDKFNHMLYVVAMEEGHYLKLVIRSYDVLSHFQMVTSVMLLSVMLRILAPKFLRKDGLEWGRRIGGIACFHF